MRTIEFGVGRDDNSYSLNENDKRIFEFLFNGFIIGGHLVQSKNIMILRRELSILEKFEAISKDCDCGRLIAGTKEPDRELIGGMFSINDREFDMLYEYVGSVPWATGKSVRHALNAMELLKNAAQVSDGV